MEISDTAIASALLTVKKHELSTIPDNLEINHTFSAGFERKMDLLIASFEQKERSVSSYTAAFIKAAAVILILCIGSFSLAMTNPKARADFKNAVTEFYETHIKFYFISSNETPVDFTDYEGVTASYIPQGFKLKEKYCEYEAVGYVYENKDENKVYNVYVSLNDGLAVHTDKDNIEEVIVSGRQCYLISGINGEMPYSTLIVTGNKITVTIYGHLSREEIIKVGESLTQTE